MIVVPSRFNGPPASGNGGYMAGMLAAHVGGVVEVTLVAPPPLDTAMLVEKAADVVTARAGDHVVATARRAEIDLDVPPPPSRDDALAMSGCYIGFTGHPFSTCFVCGPARAVGDGLRIFAGRRPSDHAVAAPWTVDPSLADAHGHVPAPIVWAALDCPGYFAFAEPGKPAVLGRMTAEVMSAPHVDDRCIVIGWNLGADGRKRFAGTALHAQDGTLLARARQTWIEIPPASPPTA